MARFVVDNSREEARQRVSGSNPDGLTNYIRGRAEDAGPEQPRQAFSV